MHPQNKEVRNEMIEENELVLNQVRGALNGRNIKVKQFAYEQKYEWQDYGTIEFYSSETLSDEYKSLIGEVEIEFYVPETYDRRVIQVLTLRKFRAEKVAQFQNTLAELDETISKLEAIGYTKTVEDVSDV